jgi:demethylmenaquinone methyltransferase/2-methoxy-6-polyprenyl-1,4-benzoquinol methylase
MQRVSDRKKEKSVDDISRVTRSKAEAKAAYDAMSGWYDLLAGSSERRFREECLKMLNVQAGEAILEIGFGTGEALLSLARSAGKQGKVFGIDISDGMCRRAQMRLRKAGLGDSVELRSGDATTLPFSSESMDAIFIAFTLELFDTPEIPVVIAECRRVLRQEGRIGLVAMAKPDRTGWMVRLYEWAHHAFPVWVDCRPIRSQIFLEEAGFTILDRKERSMWRFPVEILQVKKSISNVTNQ